MKMEYREKYEQTEKQKQETKSPLLESLVQELKEKRSYSYYYCPPDVVDVDERGRAFGFIIKQSFRDINNPYPPRSFYTIDFGAIKNGKTYRNWFNVSSGDFNFYDEIKILEETENQVTMGLKSRRGLDIYQLNLEKGSFSRVKRHDFEAEEKERKEKTITKMNRQEMIEKLQKNTEELEKVLQNYNDDKRPDSYYYLLENIRTKGGLKGLLNFGAICEFLKKQKAALKIFDSQKSADVLEVIRAYIDFKKAETEEQIQLYEETLELVGKCEGSNRRIDRIINQISLLEKAVDKLYVETKENKYKIVDRAINSFVYIPNRFRKNCELSLDLGSYLHNVCRSLDISTDLINRTLESLAQTHKRVCEHSSSEGLYLGSKPSDKKPRNPKKSINKLPEIIQKETEEFLKDRILAII